MKKQILLSLGFICLFTVQVFSQSFYRRHPRYYYSPYGETIVIDKTPDYFSVGESVYSTNYRGFKNLMSDLEQDDPELLAKIYPSFDSIRRKRKTSNIIFFGTFITSSALLLSGIPNSSDSDFMETGVSDLDDSANQAFLGIGILALGGIIGALIMPGQDDYLHLVNQFNRNSKQKKIKWDVGIYNPNPDMFGLTLSAKF